MAHVVNIHTDHHGGGLAQLLGQGQLVEVETRLGVDLSNDVGEDAQL